MLFSNVKRRDNITASAMLVSTASYGFSHSSTCVFMPATKTEQPPTFDPEVTLTSALFGKWNHCDLVGSGC